MKRKNGIYKYILNIVLLFSSLFVYSCNKVDIDYKYVDVFLFVGDGLISGIGESEDVIKCDNAYEYDSNGLRLLNNKNGGLVSSFCASYESSNDVVVIDNSVTYSNINDWNINGNFYKESVNKLNNCLSYLSNNNYVTSNVNVIVSFNADENDNYINKFNDIVNNYLSIVDNCFVIPINVYENGKIVSFKDEISSEQIKLCKNKNNVILGTNKFYNVPFELCNGKYFHQGVYNVAGYDLGNNISAYLNFNEQNECLVYQIGEASKIANQFNINLKYNEFNYKNEIYFDSNVSNGNGSYENPYNDLSILKTLNIEGGTKILLKNNSKFIDGFDLINIVGLDNEPILISNYGEGNKPIIEGNNRINKAVLYLENCSNVIVENLEIYDSNNLIGDKRGVLINSNKEGIYRNITLRSLYIHDIKGYLDQDNNGSALSSKKTGGIQVWVENRNSRYDNLLITNNKIENVDNVGISTYWNMVNNNVEKNSPYDKDFSKYAYTNVNITYNNISNIGKNAIFARNLLGGIIEHNVIHDTSIRCYTGNQIVTSYVDKTIIQYNEGYNNKAMKNPNNNLGIMDGSLLDADLQSKDTIWQYNYSHDNSFGLFINCNFKNENDILGEDKTIVRYNLSIDDIGNKGIIFANYYSSGLEIYNNTIITSNKTSPIILQINDDRKVNFYNNLIYNQSQNASFKLGNCNNVILQKNLIYSVDNYVIENLDDFYNKSESYLEEVDPLPKYKIDNKIGLVNAKKYCIMQEERLFKENNSIKVNNILFDFNGNKYKQSIGCYCK